MISGKERMNPAVEAWRRKHPRCRYCAFYYARSASSGGTVRACEAKRRYFSNSFSIRGMRCKLFEPKELASHEG